MKMSKIFFVALATWFFVFPLTVNSQEFTEDPLRDDTGQWIINQFMQLNGLSLNNLHTGVDVTCADCDVYAPIEPGTTCRVVEVGSNYVLLRANVRMFGDNAVGAFGHVIPNPNLIAGSDIGPNVKIGEIESGFNHLHYEFFLSSDDWIDSSDVVSPLRYSLNTAPWSMDGTDPEITDDIIVHNSDGAAGTEMVWEVYAADYDSGTYNGIGCMELMINDTVVDEFDFDKYLSKAGSYPPSADEYYYNPNCLPEGDNYPNVLGYILKWTSDGNLENKTWRLRVCDWCWNEVISPQFRFTAEEFAGEMGGRFLNGRAVLNWRLTRLGNIHHFNMYRSNSEHGLFEKVNLEPIMAVDGRLDYEFIADIPDDWASVWYKLGAATSDEGGEFMTTAKAKIKLPLLGALAVSPNPSAGSNFRFRMGLRYSGELNVDIFDIRGRKVRTVYRGHVSPGEIVKQWDGRADSGETVAAGVYLLRVMGADEILVKKIALVK